MNRKGLNNNKIYIYPEGNEGLMETFKSISSLGIGKLTEKYYILPSSVSLANNGNLEFAQKQYLAQSTGHNLVMYSFSEQKEEIK